MNMNSVEELIMQLLLMFSESGFICGFAASVASRRLQLLMLILQLIYLVIIYFWLCMSREKPGATFQRAERVAQLHLKGSNYWEDTNVL